MRDLLHFFIRNSYWFLFILLEVICFYFIFDNESYQRSVFLNSSNTISGNIYTTYGSVTSYFGLREKNEELMYENAVLLDETIKLKEYIANKENTVDSLNIFLKDYLQYTPSGYDFHVAKVINNSVSKTRNFITLNKGRNSGIEEGMGVVSHNGIIGVVRALSDNYSVVQPVINSDSRFSCKVLHNNTDAILVWDGLDPRYARLINYPKYERVSYGDTIITSGFSDIFPEGIIVGFVESSSDQYDGSFHSLKVELATKFGSIKDAIVINNKDKKEKQELENRVYNADN